MAPLPPTFRDPLGFDWTLTTLDRLPASCGSTFLTLFRPATMLGATATAVLSAGRTSTPIAAAARVLAEFGRARLERELAEHHCDLSDCRWGMREPMQATVEAEPERMRQCVGLYGLKRW